MTTTAPSPIETAKTDAERLVERLRFALQYAPETLASLLPPDFYSRLGSALEADGALDL